MIETNGCRCMPVVLSLVVIIPLVAFWVWMARDLNRNEYLRDDKSKFWTMMLVLFNVFGAIAYDWYVYQNPTDAHEP